MAGLSLTSPSFDHGAEIPKRFGYKHGNSSPPLSVQGIPEDCKSLALIMDDPDAVGAVGRVWVHWVVWNIPPPSTSPNFAESVVPEENIMPPEIRCFPQSSYFAESGVPSGSREGKTDFGQIGYGGPAPPDKRHTYVFKLYALDTKLDLERGSSKKQLEEAMRAHIIAEARLEGTFAP